MLQVYHADIMAKWQQRCILFMSSFNQYKMYAAITPSLQRHAVPIVQPVSLAFYLDIFCWKEKCIIFLWPQIEHKAPQLRYDVIEANFYGGTLADNYEMDVLDLHFQFRFSLQHRTKDGVHWNAIAHRRITALLLRHIAQAWGVMLTADGEKSGFTNMHTCIFLFKN